MNVQVGDMVSIIEMTTNGWWRGKQGLKVGSFPSQCVKRISRGTDIDGTHQRTFSPPKAKNEAEENMPSKIRVVVLLGVRWYCEKRFSCILEHSAYQRC